MARKWQENDQMARKWRDWACGVIAAIGAAETEDL
jgi:hypothetical protein